jgi:hypothetical protein
MFLIGSWLFDADQQGGRRARPRSLCIGVVAVASALALLLDPQESWRCRTTGKRCSDLLQE